jgi:outer membrane immunogenic protein
MAKGKFAGIACLALAFAFASALPAKAADMAVKAPPRPVVAAVYNWTGFYVGVNAGYGWAQDPDVVFSNITGTLVGPAAVPGVVSPDVKGFLGGVQAGYNFQSGNFVFGVEGDADYADLRGSDRRFGLIDVRRNSYGDQRMDFFGTFRGRAGVAFDRLLIYGTGGLAVGHTRSTAFFSNTDGCVFAGGGANQCPTGSSTETRWGWTAGGGLEFALGGNWTAKGEYLYYDLGRTSYVLTDPNFPGVTYGATTEYRGHIARAGLNHRFDWASPVVAKY